MAGRSRWRARGTACAVIALASAATLTGCRTNGTLSATTARPWSASGSASGTTGHASSESGKPGKTGTGGRSSSPAPSRPAASPSGTCAARVYARLTLAQRVGQLFLVGVSADIAGSAARDAVDSYYFGGVLLPKNAAGTSALASATASLQALASSATGGVRFLVAANQEGGQIQQLTGPGFSTIPSALVQGTWPTSMLRGAAQGWAGQLHAAGVNLDLAPVMGVVPEATAASNAPIGALDREFGHTPAGNGAHGAAFIDGMAAAGVATMAKHFPGLGRVAGNTDFTANVTDDVTTPDDPYLGSFRAAVRAGVPYMMVALATYTKIDPARLAVFSPAVMRLLRDGLGFGGVIVSDDLGDAKAVQAIPAGQRAIDFLDAGGDLITSQSIAPAEQMASAVVAKASGDAAFRATVDAAVRRVLAAKQAQGLLPC